MVLVIVFLSVLGMASLVIGAGARTADGRELAYAVAKLSGWFLFFYLILLAFSLGLR